MKPSLQHRATPAQDLVATGHVPPNTTVMIKFATHSAYNTLLILLICTDLVFIGFEIKYIYITGPSPFFTSMYTLGHDRGYAEFFQYIKQYWIVILLGLLALNRLALIYVSWSLVFAYLLVDDAPSIHETYGLYAANVVSIKPMFGLLARDVGELLVTGVVGAALLVPLIVAYSRCDSYEKTFSRYLVALFGFLAFFGVLVDTVHAMSRNTALFNPLGILEDGGEMVVMSLMLWFVFRHNLGSKPDREHLPTSVESLPQTGDSLPLS